MYNIDKFHEEFHQRSLPQVLPIGCGDGDTIACCPFVEKEKETQQRLVGLVRRVDAAEGLENLQLTSACSEHHSYYIRAVYLQRFVLPLD